MRLLTLVLGSTLALTTACGGGASKGDCQKLLEHLIDLEMKAGGSDSFSGEMKEKLEEQKQGVLTYAEGQSFVATCTDKTPPGVVECMLEAQSIEDVGNCDK